MINVCNKIKKDPIITKSENRRKAILYNTQKKEVNEVIVDNCLIKSGNKCDFLWEMDEKCFYIELKGKNVSHALTQIENTIKFCEDNFNHKNIKKIGVIVISRYPQEDSSIQIKKKKLKKRGVILNIKSNKWEGYV